MLRVVVVTFLGVLSLSLAAPLYPEFLNINSRVPGDKLIWQSSPVQQNLDFFGQTTYVINFPQDGSRSPYEITHIHIDAKESTGLMDLDLYGGPGTDFARLKLKASSVQSGNYIIYIYGKKK